MCKGSERELKIANAKSALGSRNGLSLKSWMDVVELFGADHPEYSQRILCEAANIPYATFHHHCHRNKRGNTIYAEHRLEIADGIRTFEPDTNSPIVLSYLKRQLADANIHCSLYLLKEVLSDIGYRW